MRCKACNGEMHTTWRSVEGLKEPILEDLCPSCLYIIRASIYDGGPSNELDLISELGVELDDDEEA